MTNIAILHFIQGKTIAHVIVIDDNKYMKIFDIHCGRNIEC
jgi:hypothetical protein